MKTNNWLGWILSISSIGVLSVLNMVEIPIWAYFSVVVSFSSLMFVEKWPQYSGYSFAFYMVSIGIPLVYITLEGYYVDLGVPRLIVGAIVGVGAMLAPVLVALNKPTRFINSKEANDSFSTNVVYIIYLLPVGVLVALIAGNQLVLGVLASAFWITMALSAVSFRKNADDNSQ